MDVARKGAMDVSEEEFGIVPVDEYTAIFPFPTKTANDASANTSHEGFWVTWYVDAARADSGKGSGANKLTYGRRLSPWSVKERVKAFVSTPPTGFFSQRDVFWQTIKWPYDKDHAKWLHALIPATRLEDFRRGIQLDANTEFSVWDRMKKGTGGGRLYVDAVTWHCCCGPEDKRVRAEEKFARMLNGTGVRVSRKVGCPCGFQTSGFTESFKFMTYDGETALDTSLIRIRWPLNDKGMPVWHDKHDVVPSWPASTETKRALMEMVQVHNSLTDAQILRRWRERIINHVSCAYGINTEELYSHLAGGTMKFPREYYISVHDVKRVRQRSKHAVWKKDKSEVISLLDWIIADEGISVVRFRNMEIAPARVNGRLVHDDAFDEQHAQLVCAWCDFTTDTAGCLEAHMEACLVGFKSDELARQKYVERYVRSCESGNPSATYEAEGDTNSAWWYAASTFISTKLRVTFDYIADNLSSVLSPKKEVAQVHNALVVYDGRGGELSELEKAMTDEQHDVVQHYLDQVRNRSMDRALEPYQIKEVDGVLRATTNLDRDVSQGPSHARYCPVTVRDMQTLRDTNWLNDAVINWQLQFLNDFAHDEMETRGEDVPRVHFFLTATLYEMSLKKWIAAREKAEMSSGVKLNFEAASYYDYDRVKKHLRKRKSRCYDCMQCEYLFFPVHWPGHWAACIASLKHREVYYLDSMGVCDEGHRGAHIAEDVVRLMCDAYRERNEKSSPKDWTVMQKNKLDVPKQLNSYDCGMFMLSFARHLLDHGIDNKPLSKYKFRTEHMAHRRRVVAYEILTAGVHDAIKDVDTVDGDAQEHMGTECDEELLSLIREQEQALSRECGYNVRSNRIGEFYLCAASKLPRIRVHGELRVVVKPFCLVVMTPIQANWMWRYGHGCGVQMDSTFGTNKARYSLFTLVVREATAGIGLPGAWVIVSDERTATITYCLRAIRETLTSSRPNTVAGEWTPSAFMVDCALSELAAVKQVFGPGMCTFWCHWHVMQAMKKRALRVTAVHRKHVLDRAFTLVRFDDKMDRHKGVLGFYRMLTTFMEYCRTHEDRSVVEYGNYFGRQWLPNYTLWAKAFRAGMKYGIDTTSTAESYHNFIKQLAHAEENSRWQKQRRMDWLCYFLTNVALPEFVQREHVTRDRLPYHIRNTYQSKMREYGAFIKSGKLRFELRNSSTVFCDAERREILASVHVQVTNTTSGVCSTHEVSNLHMLQTSALQRHHQLVTCNCVEGRNDVLCFAKLHAMVEANLQYTLAAFQLDDNVVHDDALRARREERRRVSHDNARGLKQNSENSGTGTIRKSNTSSQAEIYELLRRVQSITDEEDPIRRQKAVTALKVAVKELEAGNEKRQVEPGDDTTSVPFRENIPSDSGIGMHIFASATGKLPRMEHKRSHLNEDSLVRGKGILERKRSRS